MAKMNTQETQFLNGIKRAYFYLKEIKSTTRESLDDSSNLDEKENLSYLYSEVDGLASRFESYVEMFEKKFNA